jgi:Zn finger protein HypA/HybF involved in hydrogenase expression
MFGEGRGSGMFGEGRVAVLTSWIGIRCRGCAHRFRTRVRGSKTRCPQCGRQRYVRMEQAPEWIPDGEGPGRWLECRHCRYEWTSRAEAGQSLRCPRCRRSRRVPIDADAAPISRAPVPRMQQVRPLAPWGSLRPLLPAGWPVLTPPARLPAPSPPPAPARRPASRPALVPAPPRPRPAPSPPPPVGSPWAIGPGTDRALAALGLGRTVQAPPGMCVMWDGRLEMACPSPGARRAVLSSSAFLPVCDGHAYALERRAQERGRSVALLPLR